MIKTTLNQCYTRDKTTWLAYFLCGYFGYVQSSTIFLLPFIRSENNWNYTSTSFIIILYASGLFISSMCVKIYSIIFNRRIIIIINIVISFIGILFIISSRHLIITSIGVYLIGMSVMPLLIIGQAVLNDWQNNYRFVALTEANAMVPVCGVTGTVLLSFLAASDFGWRSAFWVTVILFIIIFKLFWPKEIPPANSFKHLHKIQIYPIQRYSWIYVGVMFFGISIEACLFAWGTEFLKSTVNLSAIDATFVMSIALATTVVARLVVSRLPRNIKRHTLLLITLGTTLSAFLVCWLSTQPTARIVGLCLAASGTANIYPLTVVVATSMTNEQVDKAIARLTVGSSLATLTMPSLIGWLADQIGLYLAYGIIVPLNMLAILCTIIVDRLHQADLYPPIQPSDANRGAVG